MNNSWQIRLVVLVLFTSCALAHKLLLLDIPNTPFGMFLYHGSAVVIDLMLLLCVSVLLRHELSFDMQVLCVFSMVANFAGWIAYSLYVSPTYYDATIWTLDVLQFIRLFSGVRHDPVHLGIDMVPSNHNSSFELYPKKEIE